MNMFQDSQRKSSICPSLCVLVQLANIFSSCKETLLSTYKTASIHHNLPGTFPSVARVWCSDVWFCTTALHRRSPAGAVTGNYSISCTPLPSNTTLFSPTPPTDVYCMASTHWPCPSLLLFLLARNHNKPPLSPSSFRHCYPHVYCIVLHCVDPALLFAAVFARLKSTSSLVTEVLRKK